MSARTQHHRPAYPEELILNQTVSAHRSTSIPSIPDLQCHGAFFYQPDRSVANSYQKPIMWLDRLAAQSNPSPTSSQPGSRPYSPLPRRASNSPYVTSQKSGVTPRGSSLSLVSNDSSGSLLASRRVNGSGLKQSQTTYDGPDSVEVLGQILGTASLPTSTANEKTGAIEEDDLDFDFDFEGLGLRDLASSNRTDADDANSYRRQTTEECVSFAWWSC